MKFSNKSFKSVLLSISSEIMSFCDLNTNKVFLKKLKSPNDIESITDIINVPSKKNKPNKNI